MADLKRLYRSRSAEEVVILLARASSLLKEKSDLGWADIQNTLKIGAEEAWIIHDWLADKYEVETDVSNHWIRCGRTYVLNNPFPTLPGMAEALRVGERRSFLIMQTLEKRGLIRIKPDFSFERIGRMASFSNLVRQMKRIGRKYRGRCEFQLLIRTLFIDPTTALRLAQYGEEHLDLRWKGRPKELL